MTRLFQSCPSHRQSLSLLACGVLPEPERPTAEAHQAACADCRQYYAEMQGLTQALKSWAGTTPCVEPTQVQRARWRRAVERLSNSDRDGLAAWRIWWQALLPARRPALAALVGMAGMAMLVLLFFVTALRHSPTASHSRLPAPRTAAVTPGQAVQPVAITPAYSYSPSGGRIWTATPDAARATWVRRESNGNWMAVASSSDGSHRIVATKYAYDAIGRVVVHENKDFHRSAALSEVQTTNLIEYLFLSNSVGTCTITGNSANHIGVSTNSAFPWGLDQSNAPTYRRTP